MSSATAVDMGMVLAGGSDGRNSRAPVSKGRAASGGALAPEPPRATRSQPESIRTVVPPTLFSSFFGLQPGSFSEEKS